MSDQRKAAEAIIERIRREPVPTVTAADAVVLQAVTGRSLMMEKLLAIHYNQTGDTDRALVTAQAIFAAEKAPENAKNVALLLRRLKRQAEGIAFAEENATHFRPVEWNDVLAMLHSDAGDMAAAARHGTQSLELKDAACKPAPPITPNIHRYDPEQSRRNIIAFSLWGSDPRYLAGARNNAVVARYLYPGWTVRFIIDETVPADARTTLMQEGAQLLLAPKEWPAAQYGLFWRFLVEDDPNIDFYLIRDADSVMNVKERAAVEDWLASGRAFHVMRDLPTHSELILAGMWGAHRGNIGGMAKRIAEHIAGAAKKLNNRITDQEFLRGVIWPIVRQDVLVHDSHLGFGEVQP